MAKRSNKAVSGFDDDWEFSPLEADASMNGEPVIYGLNMGVSEDENKKRRLPVWAILCVLLALALIGGVLLAKHFAFLGKADQQSTTAAQKATEEEASEEASQAANQTEIVTDKAEEAKPEEASKEEEKPAEDDDPNSLSPDEVKQLVQQLSFDGQDLSLPAEQMTIEILDGRVEATHLAGNKVDPYTVTANASRRAAALAKAIGNQAVKGKDEKEAHPFSLVTWVVRNEAGNSYLAVCFTPENIPTTGDGIAVLKASPRYRLSDSLFAALGLDIPQEAGETPALLNGYYIWSDATIQ